MSSKPVRCEKCDRELTSDFEGCKICQLEQGISDEAVTRGLDQISETLKPETLNEKFEDLEVLEILGAGGMGIVYLARQLKLDRLVALKVIRPDVADAEQFEARFEREAKTLARLSHPNIVGIHDFGKQDDLYFCLMEYVDGTNLGELAGGQSLSPSESLQIVSDICNAIQYAHDNGVVHRDIKPNNILINTEGQVKIADFGLAKLNNLETTPGTRLTQTRQVFGTPSYMAPEQIESAKEVDHRADIFSLGVVFYELLTGELPIGRFDPPSDRIQVSVKLDEVVLRALEKHPERRYQSARQMQTDISNVADYPAKPPIKRAGYAGMLKRWGSTLESPLVQRTSSVVKRMIGSFLVFASIYLISLATTSTVVRTRFTLLFTGILVMAILVCLPTGLQLLISGLKSRTSHPDSISKTPPQLLFSNHGLSYLCFGLCFVALGMPWTRMDYNLAFFATGIENWAGLACLGILAIGLMCLVCIDIYEGTSFRFHILVLLLGVVLFLISWAFVMSSNLNPGLQGQLINDLFRDHVSYTPYRLSGGAPTLVIMSGCLATLGLVGFSSKAISFWWNRRE